MDKLRFTSSNIVRGMLKVWRAKLSMNLSKNNRALDCSCNPKANMYSLESMTMCKLFLPDGLSGFAQFLYRVFFVQLEDTGRMLSHYFSQPPQVCFDFFSLSHSLSPLRRLYHRNWTKSS